MKRALVLVALLLLPPAAAGTERDPEILDAPRDVTNTAADIIAAWLSYEEKGVRFSIRTIDGSLPDRNPGYVYWIEFRASGVTSSALVGFDLRGRMHGHIGPLEGPEYDRGDISSFANDRVVDLEQDRGQPSTWSGLLPWRSVPGLEPGASLVDIHVGSARYDARAGWSGAIDRARTDEVWIAQREATLLTHPAFLTGVLVVATAGGAVGGWWMLRKLRAAKA